MTERAGIARLRRMFRHRRLAVVVVGARVSEDRHVPELIERGDGATVHNPEYTSLLRDIVRLLSVVLVALALASCEACASQPPATVLVVVSYDQAPIAATADWVWHGANDWSELGVAAAQPHEADGLPTCALDWWVDGERPCALPIRITFWPANQMPGTSIGLTADRHTILSDALTADELESTVAHEVGHSVWNSHDHLLPGEVGIMSATATWLVEPTDADLRYVSRATDGAL